MTVRISASEAAVNFPQLVQRIREESEQEATEETEKTGTNCFFLCFLPYLLFKEFRLICRLLAFMRSCPH